MLPPCFVTSLLFRENCLPSIPDHFISITGPTERRKILNVQQQGSTTPRDATGRCTTQHSRAVLKSCCAHCTASEATRPRRSFLLLQEAYSPLVDHTSCEGIRFGGSLGQISLSSRPVLTALHQHTGNKSTAHVFQYKTQSLCSLSVLFHCVASYGRNSN